MEYDPCEGCSGEDCVCCSVWIDNQAERDPQDVMDEDYFDDFDDSMDGDFDSGMASAGLGTTEDYDHWETPMDDYYGGE